MQSFAKHDKTNRTAITTSNTAIICALIVLVLTAGSCARAVKVSLPVVPSTFALRSTTSSSTPIDRSKESLPVLTGLGTVPTSTLVFYGGNATIEGIVTGPEGPVAGATVQVERLVGETSAVTRVLTDQVGHYGLARVKLGRIRVRAWRSPDLAQITEDVTFTKGSARLDLKMQKYARSDLQWSVAPSPIVVGRQAAVIVQITDRLVNPDGVVVNQAISGVGVSLSARSFIQIVTGGEKLTDDKGRATFNIQCVETGPSTVSAALATGGEATLNLPDCVLPPAPPTAAPSDTGPPPTVSSVTETTIGQATIRTVPLTTPDGLPVEPTSPPVNVPVPLTTSPPEITPPTVPPVNVLPTVAPVVGTTIVIPTPGIPAVPPAVQVVAPV